MRSRDSQSLKEFMAEEARLFAAEQERKNRPVREAEEKLNEAARSLYALEKETVLTRKDPEIFVDPLYAYPFTMNKADAKKFNADQYREYMEQHPEYFHCQSNLDALSDYFERNGLQIVSALTLAKAVDRLRAFHLIEDKPIEPEPEEQPVIAPVIAEPNVHIGIDPLSGREREYTTWEVERMSSDEFRRAFKLTKAYLVPPNHAGF